MPDLILNIKPQIDNQSVKDAIALLEQLESAKAKVEGSGKTSKSTDRVKQETDAVDELNKQLLRRIRLNEELFRRGELTKNQALKNIQTLEKQAKANGLLSTSMDRGVMNMSRLGSAQRRIEAGFTGIASSSKQANFALMNLGRIVQDLPFGFLGISNNIDPALTSMKELNTTAKNTGSSLGKELLGSLKGSGGLIFALGSLLPSAILISQKGFNFYSKTTKEATKDLDEFINVSSKLRNEGVFDVLGIEDDKTKFNIVRSRIEPQYELIKDLSDELKILKDRSKDFGTNLTSTVSVEDIARMKELEKSILDLQKQYGYTEEELKSFTESQNELSDSIERNQALINNDSIVKAKKSIEDSINQAKRQIAVGELQGEKLKEISNFYFEQAQALNELSKTDDEARLKRELFTKAGREFLNMYQSLPDAIDTTTIAIKKEIDANAILLSYVDRMLGKREQEIAQRKELYKLISNPPKEQEIDESGADKELKRIEFLKDLQRQNEIDKLKGQKRQEAQIEANFQKEKIALMKQGMLDADILKELELSRDNEIAQYRIELQREASEKIKENERQLASARVNMEQATLSALTSLSQAFAGDNKSLAIAILAIEKGLAISQVMVSGAKESAKAMMTGYALLSNPATSAFAPNAFAQAKLISGTALKTAIAIGAQGLGEAIAISNRDTRTSGTVSGSVNQPQQGFFTSEAIKPIQSNPIVNLTLKGDLDPEYLSVKVEQGTNRRMRSTSFIS